MRYGEQGDKFYLILKGRVSVWVPVPHREMKRPLQKFKELVQQKFDELCRQKGSKTSNLTDLQFRFKSLKRLDEINEYFKEEQDERKKRISKTGSKLMSK